MQLPVVCLLSWEGEVCNCQWFVCCHGRGKCAIASGLSVVMEGGSVQIASGLSVVLGGGSVCCVGRGKCAIAGDLYVVYQCFSMKTLQHGNVQYYSRLQLSASHL